MKIEKLGILLLMVCFIFSSMGIQVYAASVGDSLTVPETGWKRFDNANSNITYNGEWSQYTNNSSYLEETAAHSYGDTGDITFNFVGTKIRLIGFTRDTGYSTTIDVYIDGEKVGTFSQKGNAKAHVLNFEKVGLDNKEHFVKIQKAENSGYFLFDVMDIDEDGELKPYNDNLSTAPDAPTNLIATSGDEKVDLSWDTVEGAEKYIVKRATTAGGPYITIAENITGTSYTDTDVKNDTTYYYVVCAVKDGKESSNSNEASATPTGSSSSSGDKALLRVTMINGKINEYDLSMNDVEDFIEWYEDRADNRGKPYHVIEKDYNRGPFESRKDYIAFDKILQFEVMEYNE